MNTRVKEKKLFEAKVAGRIACKNGKARIAVLDNRINEIKDEFNAIFPRESSLCLVLAWNIGWDNANVNQEIK